MKIYIKDGKECYLCQSRKKFIQKTPEEEVRQNFITELLTKYGVPLERLEVEVPLSDFKKGLRQRADIIVYEYSETEDLLYPLILVECKAPDVYLTDTVFGQVYSYDKHLSAKLIIVTNGSQTVNVMRDDNEYNEIYETPQYWELLTKKTYTKKLNNFEWVRPNFNDVQAFNSLKDEGIIGDDTNPIWYPFFTNLYGLIFDTSFEIKNITIPSFKLISDEGIRFTTFSNAAGGGWTGDYRYLILEDTNGENQIVSISMMGKLSVKGDPKWGNSKGLTILLVAIDSLEDRHLSLQLSLDRFTNLNNNIAEIIHDGTLTSGSKGRSKNQEVIDFIKTKRPNLIKNNKVYLGKLDTTTKLLWTDSNVQHFIENLIDYAFLRDEFRKIKLG